MSNYTTKTIVESLTGIAQANIRDEWLLWADSEIEEKTGEDYSPATASTQYIDGPGGPTLILPVYPIISVTKIVCDGIQVDVNSFAIYKEEGLIKVKEGLNLDYLGLDEVFAKGTQNIEVTGIFGYSSVPKLVEELATLIVMRIMGEKGLINIGLKSESIGDYSYTLKDNAYDITKAIDDLFYSLIGDEVNGEAV